MAYGNFQGINEFISNLENCNSDKQSRIPEDKKPLMFMPPNPLPKIEIPIVIKINRNNCLIFRSIRKYLGKFVPIC